MSLPPRDISDLEWALGIGMTRFVRSTFGTALERADIYGHSSDKRRLPQLARADRWHTMIPRAVHDEPSYCPDDRDLDRFARVSRSLLEVSRSDATSYAVLVAYYGDAGSRWGLETVGRVAAIYPMTRSGRIVLGADKGRRSLSGLRQDEAIAADIQVQAVQPIDTRRKRHEYMREEAKALLAAAEAAYVKARTAVEERRRVVA